MLILPGLSALKYKVFQYKYVNIKYVNIKYVNMKACSRVKKTTTRTFEMKHTSENMTKDYFIMGFSKTLLFT